MPDHFYQQIKHLYLNSKGDSTHLFETVISIGQKIGIDNAWRILERCVTAKRLTWVDENIAGFELTSDPLLDGYKTFYEVYLGVTVPEDGEIVAHTAKKIVTRWWNHCPTLEACERLGLETREVCKVAYQKPVQSFLSRIDPRLRFDRNYAAIRPHTPYCEEIITLEDSA